MGRSRGSRHLLTYVFWPWKLYCRFDHELNVEVTSPLQAFWILSPRQAAVKTTMTGGQKHCGLRSPPPSPSTPPSTLGSLSARSCSSSSSSYLSSRNYGCIGNKESTGDHVSCLRLSSHVLLTLAPTWQVLGQSSSAWSCICHFTPAKITHILTPEQRSYVIRNSSHPGIPVSQQHRPTVSAYMHC